MASNFDSFVKIDIGTSIPVALTKLRQDPTERLILITDKTRPVSLLKEEQLFALVKNDNHTFEDVKKKLLPIFSLDSKVYREHEYADLLPVLMKAKAPGALVRTGTSFKVASLFTLVRQLETNLFFFSGVSIPIRTYICRFCEPPSIKRPMNGPPPECDLGHGPMEEGNV